MSRYIHISVEETFTGKHCFLDIELTDGATDQEVAEAVKEEVLRAFVGDEL